MDMADEIDCNKLDEDSDEQDEGDVTQRKLLIFTSAALKYAGKSAKRLNNYRKYARIGEKYQLRFKMIKCNQALVKTILHSYGFEQCSSKNANCNIIWSGSHLKPHVMRVMASWQRVNHFPRSFLLTRKDKLYECLGRAQALFGDSYNIIPDFFVTPKDYQKLVNDFNAQTHVLKPFIVKPVASSQGNGIFIVQNPCEIPLGSPMLVSRYIENPYLINGHKFDLRLYVLVTSFYPLVAYMYSDGLARFASEKYPSTTKNYEQHYSHLTNYSLNKNNGKFVKNESAETEDRGHKWTLGALLRQLQSNGVDTNLLMVRVEDVVLKALFSVQGLIAVASRNVVAHSKCCFELFGFDILIDAYLKPWLLEVNLSPSLSCDTPLDLQLKSCLVCDVLTLAAIPLIPQKCQEGQCIGISDKKKYVSKDAAIMISQHVKKQSIRRLSPPSPRRFCLNSKERAKNSLERWKIECDRLGGFIPLFPRENSFPLYRHLMEEFDNISWDALLFEDIYGSAAFTLFNEKTALRVQKELMDCQHIVKTSALSESVKIILMSALTNAENYASRLTKSGVKYANKLPRIRPELRKRSESFEETEAKLRPVALNYDEIVFTTNLQIDRASFERARTEKVNSRGPLQKTLQGNEDKTPINPLLPEFKTSVTVASVVDENAEPEVAVCC